MNSTHAKLGDRLLVWKRQAITSSNGEYPLCLAARFRPNSEQILPVIAHFVHFFGVRLYGVTFLHPSTCDVARLVFGLWGFGTQKLHNMGFFWQKTSRIWTKLFSSASNNIKQWGVSPLPTLKSGRRVVPRFAAGCDRTARGHRGDSRL